jgi:catechol 2,3-dioxygenase-like lactoylglutathione lyase family enzyme
LDRSFVAEVVPANNHVALRVKDLEASVRFYHEVMGLPILRQFGPADSPRAVFISGIQLVRQTQDPGPNPYGIFDHVGIAVANIADVCARLDAAGYAADTPLNKRTFTELNNRELLSAYYRDPDGNRVELVHWL